MENQSFATNDTEALKTMLSGSGYSDKAIDYYIKKADMGVLNDANQVSELTGHCGDTMKVYLKIGNDRRIQDAKIQVMGCPGAVASAMVVMEMAKGKTIEEAKEIRDRDVFRILEQIPEQKQHCIRLSVKTLQKALEEYDG